MADAWAVAHQPPLSETAVAQVGPVTDAAVVDLHDVRQAIAAHVRLLLSAAYGLSAIVASARPVAAALRWLPLVASSLLAATRPFLQQAAASIPGGGIRCWTRLAHGVEVTGLLRRERR